ncbi:MAG: HAD hydrolase family protein [Candidatus Nanopelagicales bacterium]
MSQSSPANRKAVFLDVDGTYVNDRGVAPASAVAAVRAARAAGHLVFLCTGRSMAEMWDHVLAAGFDGIIAAAGGYTEIAGVVTDHKFLPRAIVDEAVAFFDEHGTEYILECNDGLHGSAGAPARLRELVFGGVTDEAILAELEIGVGPFIEHLIVGDDTATLTVNKMAFLGSDLPISVVGEHFGDRLTVHPGTVPAFGANSGELSLPGITKATAIEAALARIGVERADSIGIGDAGNDLEMLDFVGVAVAMGNATEAVKAAAQFVTAVADADGIAEAFGKLGLIGATAG